MRCFIIDDESTARIITRQLVEKNPDLQVEGEFSNAVDAMKRLNREEVDLIFLDIHMPDFTGFDFIQTLKKPPLIIFTTSDRNLAIEAFEYDCIVDYLLKPIVQERFDKAVQKARKISNSRLTSEQASEIGRAEEDLYVNIDRRLTKINIPTINLVEAKGDYIYIKTIDKNFTVHSTLKKIQEKLPEDIFLKVHRSYIINITKIIDIEDNSVLIERDVIPISRSNRTELMKRINLL